MGFFTQLVVLLRDIYSIQLSVIVLKSSKKVGD